MKLKKLTQTSPDSVEVVWSDGHGGPIDLRVLRDSCPCAGCKGETVLLQTYVPPPADKQAAGRYKLISAEKVGGYAMKFRWGDGHAEGLYTWELIRSLCGCGCQGREKSL